MKTLIAVFSWALFLISASVARDPWVSQTGLSASTLQSRLTTFSNAGYHLVPVCVSGYEEVGAVRYAALWGKATDAFQRQVQIGLNVSQFISTNTTLQAQGWRIVWLNGYAFGGTDHYNAIYSKTNGSAQVVQLGDSSSAHQAADDSLSSTGYYLGNLCVFRSGINIRYGAWWNHGTFAPITTVSYDMTATGYQTDFNNRAGTWRLVNVCGYESALGSGDRYTAVWRKPAQTSGWGSIHGMEKLNYFAADSNHTGIGWRPSFQQGWESDGGVKFNAIWVENGGLPSSRVAQIDSLVNTALAANDIPALSLAVSFRGRLIFNRAYGVADVASNQWAGTDHRFRIASVSKAVTGVSVLHSLAAFPGRTLDSNVFGTGAVFGSDYGTTTLSTREKDISIRDLLHHVSGWPNDGKLWYDSEPSWGSGHQQLIDWQLDNVTVTSDPGTIGRYSNLGYTVAARVVEKLSGQTYEDYTVNDVLASCGISGSYRMAVGDRTQAQKKFNEVTYYPNPSGSYDPYLIDPRRMDGSTAWIARPSDLLLLTRRVDGDPRHTDILSASNITALRTRMTPDSSTGYSWQTYGCGWYTDNYANPGYWGHNGSMAGTRAEMIAGTDDIHYAWVANTQGSISNSALETILDQITASGWPEIDLFGSYHPAYDAWVTVNFPVVERGQPGLREVLWHPLADPDSDELPNAAEYYLGLDPLAGDRSPFQTAKVGSNFRVRWLRKTGTEGAVISVSSSTNLTSWLTLFGVIDTPGGLVAPVGYSWQEILIPMTQTKRYFRFEFQIR